MAASLCRRTAFAGGMAALTAAAAGPTDLSRHALAQGTPRPTTADEIARGFSRQRLGRIAGVMQAEAERGSFPGAVTLIAPGRDRAF